MPSLSDFIETQTAINSQVIAALQKLASQQNIRLFNGNEPSPYAASTYLEEEPSPDPAQGHGRSPIRAPDDEFDPLADLEVQPSPEPPLRPTADLWEAREISYDDWPFQNEVLETGWEASYEYPPPELEDPAPLHIDATGDMGLTLYGRDELEYDFNLYEEDAFQEGALEYEPPQAAPEHMNEPLIKEESDSDSYDLYADQTLGSPPVKVEESVDELVTLGLLDPALQEQQVSRRQDTPESAPLRRSDRLRALRDRAEAAESAASSPPDSVRASPLPETPIRVAVCRRRRLKWASHMCPRPSGRQMHPRLRRRFFKSRMRRAALPGLGGRGEAP